MATKLIIKITKTASRNVQETASQTEKKHIRQEFIDDFRLI